MELWLGNPFFNDRFRKKGREKGMEGAGGDFKFSLNEIEAARVYLNITTRSQLYVMQWRPNHSKILPQNMIPSLSKM